MYSAAGVNQTLSTIGGLAVGVPGEMRGWEQLHSRHGRLPWAELFQPAIHLARNGFVVNVDLADAIAQYATGFIISDPNFAATYAPNGTTLKQGDTCYRPNLADTLELIANEGVEVFYTGKIAQGIVDTTSKTGGIMTLDDLAGYEAIIREPVNITYRLVQQTSTLI
jgi:gamma-glutamyltranspeptidase/glutathione hydrolase